MTIADYDKAMLARWQYYFPNTFFVTSEETLIKEVRNQLLARNPGLDQTKVSIYPFLALRRIGLPEVGESNYSSYQSGLDIPAEEHQVTINKFLLRYYLDIYSTERNNFDELLIEVQENFQRNGTLTVRTEDRLFQTQSFTLTIEDMLDNTDLETQDEESKVYRATIVYSMDAIIYRRFKHLRVDKCIIDYNRKGGFSWDIS